MRVLLGSGGNRTESRLDRWRSETVRNFDGVERILFVPWASVDHDGYAQRVNEVFQSTGLVFESIHHAADPVDAVRSAAGIYVGGGNTFLLTRMLHQMRVVGVIRSCVLEGGVPYMGVSAGSNVACPTMQTTNDMPVVFPGSFETLSLVPFQINAHYFPGAIWSRCGEALVEHFGETRQTRIEEFHQHNDHPVIGLREGAFLRCATDQIELVGGDATVFRRGCEPIDVGDGDDVSVLLARDCG